MVNLLDCDLTCDVIDDPRSKILISLNKLSRDIKRRLNFQNRFNSFGDQRAAKNSLPSKSRYENTPVRRGLKYLTSVPKIYKKENGARF